MDNEVRIQELTKEVESLRLRIQQIESRYEVAPRLPSTSILSDKFMTRSFAVFGHNFVASLIVSIPFYILFFIIMMTVGYSMF
jgi:hypothetical protein